MKSYLGLFSGSLFGGCLLFFVGAPMPFLIGGIIGSTKHAEPIIPPIKNGIGAPTKNRRQPPNKLPENRPKLDFNV